MLSQNEVLLQVIHTLEILEIPYLIVGSFAGAVHGLTRATADADLVVILKQRQVTAFLAALQDDFYVDENAIRAAITRHSSFNLIHFESIFKIDIFISSNSTFEQTEFDRKLVIALPGSNKSVNVISVEDTILGKLSWYQEGGTVSERQWHDILTLLDLQWDLIDFPYLAQQASSLKLSDMLKEALSQIDELRERNQ